MKSVLKKHFVLISFIISVVLMFIAASQYPGGSLIDKNSVGFDLTRNYFSNLFEAKAINGADNPGRIWAVIAMVFHSLAYGVFFIKMSKKIPSKTWAKILKIIGISNIVFIFLIATPLHDIGVISIVLTLLGLFVITVFVVKSKRHLLKISCIICLLTFYAFFILFGFGEVTLAIIMQKVYNISAILLVIALEYLIKDEEFMI